MGGLQWPKLIHRQKRENQWGDFETETEQNEDRAVGRGVSAQGRVIFGHSGSGRDAGARGDWGMRKDKDESDAHWTVLVFLVKTDMTSSAEAVGRVLGVKTIQCRL